MNADTSSPPFRAGNGRPHRRVAISLACVFALAVVNATARGGSQMFPTKRPARGLSAFLVRPLEGNTAVPAGWRHRADQSFGNSAIADESLDAVASGATCKTTSYQLPRCDYAVSVLFHMRTLATNIQQRFGAAVILSTPHKWTRGVHLLSHRQPAMVDALRAYCQATGFALADVYNEYGPNEYDGIHPGDVGHQHIADAYIAATAGRLSVPKIRSLTVASDFRDNGDGTVSDTTTGLIWTRNADLARGAQNAAETAQFAENCNQDAMFDQQNWRLPTRDELLKLVDPETRGPALPPGHPFQSVSGWYRTSTPEWGVDMETGIPWSSGRADGKLAKIWLVSDSE